MSREALQAARERSLAEFVRSTVLLFLQACYSQRPAGENAYHYDDDETKTELLIADNANEFLVSKELRPALIATRGPLAWMNTTMSGNMVGKNILSNTTTSRDLLQGSIGISALSRSDLESEQLASEVFTLFKSFRPVLQKLGFHSIKSAQLSETRLIEQEGYGKLWMTTVSVVCHLSDMWTLEPESLSKLRKVIMDFTFKVGDEEFSQSSGGH